MDVILATASRLPRPDEDQQPLLSALAAAGLSAQALAWDDPRVDWGQARACVIRSTWNYVRHHEAFLAWTERCAAVTSLCNPPPIVRWNSHKAYLIELARAGLPVVPTRLLRHEDAVADLAEIAGDWTEVVIKPAVSAGSFATRRVARVDFAAAGQPHLEALRAGGHDVLVQPFLTSVEGHGERALVWIDGALTHAVRKSPRFAGDPQRISAAVPIAPDEAALAETILATVPRPLLYARVDLARDEQGRPCLMELELIEPSLFLDRSAEALARLAAAIGRLVR
jgi:glutathione synthase/RimK-type ligase-like ATP-grasp enzyme